MATPLKKRFQLQLPSLKTQIGSTSSWKLFVVGWAWPAAKHPHRCALTFRHPRGDWKEEKQENSWVKIRTAKIGKGERRREKKKSTQRKSLTISHWQANCHLVSKEWPLWKQQQQQNNSPSFSLTLSFIAEHELCGVSLSSKVLGNPLPTGGRLGNRKSWHCAYGVQLEHWCAINTVWGTNPKQKTYKLLWRKLSPSQPQPVHTPKVGYLLIFSCVWVLSKDRQKRTSASWITFSVRKSTSWNLSWQHWADMTDKKSIKIGKGQTILLPVLSLSHAFVGTIVELLGYKYMMPSDGPLKKESS